MLSSPASSAAAIVVLIAGFLVAGTATAQVAGTPLPAVPTPSSTEAPTPAVLTVGRVPVQVMVSGDQVDAEGYVSLARRSLETCGPIGSQPPAAAQQQYAGALADFLAHRYARIKATSNAIVDACTAAASASASAAPSAAP